MAKYQDTTGHWGESKYEFIELRKGKYVGTTLDIKIEEEY